MEVILCLHSLSHPRCMWSQIMGFWQPVTNLRDYVSQNPPGVTFFLCLLTLAVSFICLSSYSYTHTLPNPDIEKVRTRRMEVFYLMSCRLWLHVCLCFCVSWAIINAQIILFILLLGLESFPVVLITLPAVCESKWKFIWACLASPCPSDR